MFRESSEIEGLRGERGEEVVVVDRAGLATAEGILMANHQDHELLSHETMTKNSWFCNSIAMLKVDWLSADNKCCHMLLQSASDSSKFVSRLRETFLAFLGEAYVVSSSSSN